MNRIGLGLAALTVTADRADSGARAVQGDFHPPPRRSPTPLRAPRATFRPGARRGRLGLSRGLLPGSVFTLPVAQHARRPSSPSRSR